MNDKQKTKAQLIQELEEMRKLNAQLQECAHHQEKLPEEKKPSHPTPTGQSDHQIGDRVYDTRLQTFSNIVEQASEGILVTDLAGHITYMNPAAERLFGYKLEEVIGKEPIIFNAAPEPFVSHNELVETVQRGENCIREILCRRKDGRVFWSRVNISPLRDKNGDMYGFAGLHLDITETKHVDKLAEVERDLSLRLNNSSTFTDVLGVCLDAAIGISEMDSGGIYLINEADGSINLAVHKGVSDGFVKQSAHYDKDSGRARLIMKGEAIFSRYQDYSVELNSTQFDEGLKATAVLPVKYNGQLLGCLNIASHSLEEVPLFSRTALNTVVSHIGAAIVHAQQAENIRQSRKNYDSLFNTIQDFMFIIGQDGAIIHVNEVVYKRLGYTKDELIGEILLKVHPKERHTEAMAITQSMLMGEANSCQIPLQAKDGTLIPVETKVKIGKWDGQDVIFGISRDMTAHNAYENALQESRDEFASVLDNSPIQINTFDGERFLYASKSWYEFNGQNESDLPRVDFWASTIHPEDFEKVLSTWQVLWETRRAGLIFYRVKNKLGEYRYFESRAVPVFDRAGQFKHFIGYNIDVTDRKQAEEKLLESQQRLELAVNGARIGLWDWYVQTEQIIINERWAKIIGYSLTELIPVDFKKWAQLCHPDDFRKSNEAVDRHFAGETDYYECEVRLKHKNGEWVWILARGKVFEWDKDGKPTRMTGTHLDITERKQAEFLLIDESVRRRILFEEAKDGIVILDHSRKVFEANKSFANMLGYTTEEMRQLHAWDWEANYPTKEKFLEMWPNMPTSSETVETRHRRKDGTIYDVEVSWNPMMWSGQLLLYCVCRDITERKLAEDALRESEELYRSTLKASPDSIAIYDLEGRIRIASPSKLKLLGYTRNEEVVGHSIQEFVHPKDHERIRYDIGRVLQGIAIGVNEYTALHADGRAFSVESNAEVIRDAAGNPTGIVVITRDITERKRAEAALRESERNYREIFNATNEAIFLQDVETGRVLDVNDAVLQMFGFDKKEEILGTGVGHFSISVNEHPYTREEAFRRIRLAVEEGPQVFEWLTQRKNGERFWVEISLRRTEIGGEGRILAVIRDISERKQIEEALQKSARNYREIFNATTEAIFLHDPTTGRVLDVNDTMLRMFGYDSKDDVLSGNVEDISTNEQPYTQAEAMRWIHLAIEKGPQVFEWRAKKKNGDLFWVEVSLRSTEISGEGCVLAVTRDISERKLAEAALQESERNYREIFNATNEAIFLHDAATGNLLDVNDTMLRMYGYETKEDVLKTERKSFVANDPPYTYDESLRRIRLAIEKGPQVFEWRAKKKNGEHFWVEVSLRSTNVGGEGCVLAVVHNITERKRAEQALKESEERFRTIFYTSPDAIIITRMEDGLIVDINPSVTRLLGYAEKDIVGKTTHEVNIWANLNERRELIRRLKKTGYCENFEFSFNTKDGSVGIALMSASAMVLKGVPHLVTITRDITEIKRAEAALQKSERNYREIFNATSEAIFLQDAKTGSILDINEAVLRMFGIESKDEILGGNVGNLIVSVKESPYTQEDALRWIHLAVEQGPQVFEWMSKKKSGERFWVEVSLRSTEVGGEGRVLAVMRNITERKRAENELKESEERFRRIFYTTPDAVIITRADDGLFVDVNHSFTQLTGYSRDEVIGNTSPSINIWTDLKDREELVRKIKKTGRCDNLEFSVRKKDGSYGIGLMSASGMVLRGIPHIVSITRDITERKRAEEEIRKLSEVVRQSPVSVVITDTEGNISYVNPKFSEVTGYTFEEIKGQNPRILKSGDTSSEEYKVLWNTIKAGNIWQGRFHNKRKDGSMFWEDATISPLFDDKDNITHFLAIKEDITHSVLLEQQLRQALKMEAIGRLAGGVAHDFNNLLLVIKGFSDLMLRRMNSASPHYEHVQQIQRAGNRAAELTRQLLAFSRKQILQPKVLDLSALLKDMEKMLRRIIGEDIDLVTIYEDDLYKVKADPGQIEQVVLNLAVNARDAMPSGGRLAITSQNAYLDEDYVKANEGSSVGHYAMISITDTGIGIDKQTQAHIFEPFFTTKDLGKGTGLGLSTVYGIIKQSGGNIWVYSEPGEGTTFKIYLPSIEDAPDIQKLPGKSKNAMRGIETILVVEDEDVVCELLKTGLEDLGYKIFKANNGLKALELVEKHANEIQLMLTDVVMPEMSGRELADKVAVLSPNIKTLFMSGYTDSEIVHHGMLDDGIAFIQKPFTIPEVAKRIRTMLDYK